MTTNCTKNDDSTVTLTVTLDGERWQKARKKAFNKRKQGLNLKGFRKGQVPDVIAKKYIPAEAVYYYAVDAAAPELLEEGILENNLKVIDRPSMDYKDASDESVTIVFTIPVLPEVKLGDYKDLGIAKDAVSISDEDVDNAIDAYRHREAVLEEAEEGTEAKNGDEVVIDFTGTIDGEEFEGGSAEDQELVLGSNQFIPGFESQVEGMKKGDVKDITVTFPENYPASNLAGKEAVFHVTLKDLKSEILPELTDEFVASLNLNGVNTVDEMKAYERKVLEGNAERNAEQKWTDEILTKVSENAEVEVPEVLVQDQLRAIMNNFAQNLKQNGIDLQDYISLVGGDQSVVEEQFRPQAAERAKLDLVLEAIGDKEDIKVTEEELDSQLGAMAKMYGMSADQLKGMVSIPAMSEDMRRNKIVQFLKSVNE